VLERDDARLGELAHEAHRRSHELGHAIYGVELARDLLVIDGKRDDVRADGVWRRDVGVARLVARELILDHGER